MTAISPEALEEFFQILKERHDPTINGFCTRNKCSRQKCYDEMNAGALPYVLVGKHRRIFAEHEAEWKKRRSVNMEG